MVEKMFIIRFNCIFYPFSYYNCAILISQFSIKQIESLGFLNLQLSLYVIINKNALSKQVRFFSLQFKNIAYFSFFLFLVDISVIYIYIVIWREK